MNELLFLEMNFQVALNGVGYLKNNRQNKRTGFQSVLYASAIPPSVLHKMNDLV